MFLREPNVRLRTKFLLSLLLITASLSCATLLVVQHIGRRRAEQEVTSSGHSALLIFQQLLKQRQVALSRKADLLATLAMMSNNDTSSVEDSTEDALGSGAIDIIAVADSDYRLVALNATHPEISVSALEHALRISLARGNVADWWYLNGHLYQVALQRVDRNPVAQNNNPGTAIVGQEIDYNTVHDLGRISASQVVFAYGRDVVVSTFPPLQEQTIAQQLQDQTDPQQIQLGKDRFYVDAAGLNAGYEPEARLIVLKSYKDATAFLTSLNRLLLVLGLLAVLAGAVLVFLISNTFTRPLANLVAGVRALESGDYSFPLEARGGDEVARVTRAFDRMRSTLQRNEAHREQLETQLRQSQKMEALGRLAGGVAHDFNNLLTIIKGHCDLLTEGLDPESRLAESNLQIRKASERAASLTRQMLAFSRMQVLNPEIVNLNALIEEVSGLLKRLIPENIVLTIQPDPSLGQVKADTSQIEQAFLNLLVNARDAMPHGGHLIVATKNVVAGQEFASAHPPMTPGRYILLSVKDTGQGMDAQTKSRVFEPFFTTKEKHKGTGLGLSTVYGVIKQSGGFIWVESELGKGSTFEIYLPRVDEQVAPVPLEIREPAEERAPATVLLAEDEEEVRALASKFLTSAGYRVLAARDGVEAIEMAERTGDPIDLLITDIVMPKMRGPELARRLKKRVANVKVLYMSAYLEPDAASGDFLEGALYLQKPFSRDMLVQKIEAALASKPSASSSVQPART